MSCLFSLNLSTLALASFPLSKPLSLSFPYRQHRPRPRVLRLCLLGRGQRFPAVGGEKGFNFFIFFESKRTRSRKSERSMFRSIGSFRVLFPSVFYFSYRTTLPEESVVVAGADKQPPIVLEGGGEASRREHNALSLESLFFFSFFFVFFF